MKTRLDPRHKRRQTIVKIIFADTFHPQTSQDELFVDIKAHQEFIDGEITKIAPEFPIDKIHKIDLSILRLAVYELMIDKKQPPKVVVDEAIELAKEFGGDTSPAFINGALGKLLKLYFESEKK